MPLYYSCLENTMTNFYYQKDSRTALRIYDNVVDNEKELAIVDADAKIVFSAIMEVECKKKQVLLQKFC